MWEATEVDTIGFSRKAFFLQDSGIFDAADRENEDSISAGGSSKKVVHDTKVEPLRWSLRG